jgi:hypothetical protein
VDQETKNRAAACRSGQPSMLFFVLFKSLGGSLVLRIARIQFSQIFGSPVSIYGSRIEAPFISATDRSGVYKGSGNFDRVSNWTYVLPATRMPKSSRVQERNRMNVLAATWHLNVLKDA